MVRRTFSQAVLYGDSRRSLRSDSTSCDSNNQMTTGSNNWKSLLSKRTPLPSFSNGHHLRSKSDDNSAKLHEEFDSVECNGLSTTHHCYGTRHGGKTPEHGNLKLTSRKSSPWDGHLDVKYSQNRTSDITTSECGDINTVVSPAGHKLRSRHVWFPNSIPAGVTDFGYPNEQVNSKSDCFNSLGKDFQVYKEDSVNSDIEVCEVGNKSQRGLKNPDSKQYQNQAMKRKRLTAEEKLIEDNKAYYKLEVKNSKLRSSGYYLSQADQSLCVSEESSTSINVPISSVNCNGMQSESRDIKVLTSEKSEPAIEVKRNKIRLSELSLLNNEAENFMFGEPSHCEDSEESSDQCDESCTRNLNSVSCDVRSTFKDCLKESKVSDKVKNLKTFNGNTSNLINKSYDCSESSDCSVSVSGGIHCESDYKLLNEVDSIDLCSNGVRSVQKRHRRPRTQNESFLNDGPGLMNSSLNMPKLENDNPWTDSKEWSKRNSETSGVKSESNVDVTLTGLESDVHEQSDTVIKGSSSNERDDINMKVHNSSEVKEEALIRLCFSFEGIPEGEPWYQTYQRQDDGEEYYLSGVNDCLYWKSFLLPYELPLEKINTSVNTNTTPKSTNVGTIKRRKRKANQALLDKKPRKSPRCHASTLAILSSLMHHRKRKDSDKVRDEVFKTCYYSNENVDTSVHENLNCSESGKDVSQNLDQLLGLSTEVALASDNTSLPVSDELKCVKSKSPKGKRSHKCVNPENTKKWESDNVHSRDNEGLDVDPLVLEQLVDSGENPLNCIDDLAPRNRGGPCMDVITLLDSYGNCGCVDEVRNRDLCKVYENGFQPSSIKESFNGSECTSSTCETIQFSDVADSVRRVRGKKRKRKKNLTGWPVEKQKLKRRLMLKLARPTIDMNASIPEAVEGEEGEGAHDPVDSNTEKCEKKNEEIGIVLAKKSESSELNNKRHESIDCEPCVELSSNKNKTEPKNANRTEAVDKNSPVECVVNNCMNLSSQGSSDKLFSARSIESNSQLCDFQPRVRVKKINNVSNLNFIIKTSASASSVNNSRRLRSTSSYLSNATLRKKQFYECAEKMEVARRASARMKKSCSRWDSWSTRRRR